MPTATHPDATALAAFSLGKLSGPEQQAVEVHVAECQTCCEALMAIGPDSLVGLAREAMATCAPGATETLPRDVPTALIDHPRYAVKNRIGAGGMGAVYKAEHRVMGRTVALKVMASRLVGDPAAVDRFRREVRMASCLTHPNIVTAYDADEAGGLHFLVMELVDGVSLDRLVKRKGPLPAATACHLTRQAALALQHAFEKGMVHRDIKPHNLMVNRKGQVKVLDFGLARIAQSSEEDGQTAGVVTSPDVVLGTPDFIAPEQARRSASADTRSDLYALGCTLFYLLTGRPPFPGDSAMAKLISHAHDAAPRLSDARPDVPEGLSDIVARLMAKDPSDRYATPAEVAAALLPFAKSSSGESIALVLPPAETQETVAVVKKTRRKKQRRRARGRWRIAAMACGGVIVAIAMLAIFNRKPTPAPILASGASLPATVENRAAPRVLMVLPSTMFWEGDYTPVRNVLEQGGCQVAVSSSAKVAKPDPAGGGRDVIVDLTPGSIRPADWDAIVICGGDGVIEYLNHRPPYGPMMTKLLREASSAGVILAAVGKGPGVLADAGLLEGRRASAQSWLRNKPVKGVTWTDSPAVVDGRIVTGQDEPSAEPFARLLLAQLKARPRR